MAELTSAAFLGVPANLAHATSIRSTVQPKEDYRGMPNIFGRVRFDSSPELTAVEKPVKRSMDDDVPAVPVRRRKVYVRKAPTGDAASRWPTDSQAAADRRARAR